MVPGLLGSYMDLPRSFLELPWTLEAFSELARAFQSSPELPGLPKSFPGLAAATRSSRRASWSSLIRPGTFQGVLIRQDAPGGYAGAQERRGAIPTPSRSLSHQRTHAQWYPTTSNASKCDHTSGGRKGRRWDRATRGPRTRKSSFFSDCNASIRVQTHTGAAESEEADQLRP